MLRGVFYSIYYELQFYGLRDLKQITTTSADFEVPRPQREAFSTSEKLSLKVEIKNLKIFANIGITADERKKKQLLKVTLNFSYSVTKGKDLEAMNNLKDYSKITKSLKQFIAESSYDTLEKLIISSSQMLTKKFKIKKVKVKINKTAVAKRYGSETVSVSN